LEGLVLPGASTTDVQHLLEVRDICHTE
jgi:hypothetical protein